MAGNASCIRTKLEGSVFCIEIHHPEQMNALTLDMYSTMTDAINEADANPDVRALLLHGTEDCFTSGNDLKDFSDNPIKGEEHPAFQFLIAISQAKKPVVAAVNGPAVGIGTTMLLHCDLVYAAPNARFQMPFVNLGLCPEGAASLLLPIMAGHQRAAELLLLGEPFSAKKAEEIGLVNKVCHESELLKNAQEQAQKLTILPPASVVLTKALLKKGNALAVKETMSEEIGFFIERLASPEAKEAIEALFERRKPDFSSYF